MSGHKGSHRRGHGNKYSRDEIRVGEQGRQLLEKIDDNNPVIKMFKEYAHELDQKHDRHERIVKINRDVTIESKRIVFLLHNAATDLENKQEAIFKEAETRLNQVVEKNFKSIALELDEQDPFLYLRAYTSGIQEFIEALLLYQFLRYGEIKPCQDLCDKLRYNVSSSTDNESCSKQVIMTIPMTEFFLGMADFTGELMRKCINGLAAGNIDHCFQICNYVKDIYIGFLSINNTGYKEIGRKVYVLKQSLLKMEYVCYNIQVRGSEIPKHMLAAVINSNNAEVNTEETENYY